MSDPEDHVVDGESEPDQRQELEALLRLQEAETAARRLERRLSELAEQAALDAHLQTVGDISAERDAHRLQVELLDAEVKRLEHDLSIWQQRRAYEQSRMYGGEIKSPRELQAIRAEIDTAEGRIDTIETELLEVMQRREDLTEGITTLESRRDELAAQTDLLTQARDAAAGELISALDEARAKADAERPLVSEGALQRYERTKARGGGVGVGSFEKGICTACRFELTPLERSEVYDDAPLATCPQCQRLLVVL